VFKIFWFTIDIPEPESIIPLRELSLPSTKIEISLDAGKGIFLFKTVLGSPCSPKNYIPVKCLGPELLLD